MYFVYSSTPQYSQQPASGVAYSHPTTVASYTVHQAPVAAHTVTAAYAPAAATVAVARPAPVAVAAAATAAAYGGYPTAHTATDYGYTQRQQEAPPPPPPATCLSFIEEADHLTGQHSLRKASNEGLPILAWGDRRAGSEFPEGRDGSLN